MSLGLYHAPLEAPADTPPFRSDDATIRGIILWHQNNPSRGASSDAAESERRRLWGLFIAWQPEPATQQSFGDRRHDTCKPFELLNFINSQQGLKSKWSRRRWSATLQAPFNAAERLGLIVKNPFRGVSFKGRLKKGRDWSGDEYQALLRGAPAVFRRFIVGVRFSGLRPGELRGLEWPNIRQQAGAIVIDDHKTSHLTDEPRHIPIPHVLLKLLGWLKRHNPAGSRHVFLNRFGQPWTCKALTKRLAALRLKIGLPDDVKLHGGRHTFATHAVMNGVPIAALMELLGHRLLATTQRYLHVGDKVEHLAEAMERAVAPAKPKPKKPAARQDQPTPLFDHLP